MLERLDEDAVLQDVAAKIADRPVQSTATADLLSRIVDPPHLLEDIGRALSAQASARAARRVDYLAREARNRALGLAGEQFVVNFERARLRANRLTRLAERVRHVAMLDGDGLGFDVLSFSCEGRERYIEVKTTQFGAFTPFHVSVNELGFSHEKDDQFSLYRVFAFGADPRMFALDGPIRASCELEPFMYVARPR